MFFHFITVHCGGFMKKLEKEAIRRLINIMKNQIHRSYRCGADYEGLKGKDLSNKKPLFPNAPKWFEEYPALRAMQAE